MFSKKIDESPSSNQKIGFFPDSELQIRPKWIIFTAENGYSRAQFTNFTIKNCEKTPVAFQIRTKNRSTFLFSPSSGILEPNERIEGTVVLTQVNSWAMEPSMFVGQIHKAVFENIAIDNDTIYNVPDKKTLANEIFFSTRRELDKKGDINIYTKMHIVVPYFDFKPTVEIAA